MEGGRSEMVNLAQRNAAIFQGVFDFLNASGSGVSGRLEEYWEMERLEQKAGADAAEAAEPAGGGERELSSSLFQVPLTQSEYECETVLKNILETMAADNEAILHMGAAFEPYAFSSNIESYSMITSKGPDGVVTDRYKDYETYREELFYSMVKESMTEHD